jgi:hypothetical protein
MRAFLTVCLVLAIGACGPGRAIFNIDAQSFMAGTGKDTIPYIIPPFTTGSASTVQRINLPPGFGSSSVDSVRITNGSVNLMNTGGAGTIGFQLFFASDSASTFTAPVALNVPATAVSGSQTVAVPITGDLSATVNDLFTKEVLWMRIAATGTNGAATPVTGRGVLTALQIRVVVQDKIF